MKSRQVRFGLFVCLLMTCVMLATASWAQSTISTGSIQGTVTDQSGAVVPNATVTITNNATGQVITKSSSGTGTFNSGTLNPGPYTVKFENKGFQSVLIPVTV